MSSNVKKTFHASLKVRGYELDGYGHVNHAVYLNYAEYARWCMIEEAKAESFFRDAGLSPAIVRAEVDFREACFLAEELEVETKLIEYRKRVARFHQIIRKKSSGKTAAEVTVTLVGINKDGRAQSLPNDFCAYFGEPSL
ncbi:MAG: acyl-CoA thioesterase [Bacteriovoracia bacterium]